MSKFYTFLILLISLSFGCSTYKPYYSFQQRKWKESVYPQGSEITRTVYLVGDTGSPKDEERDPFLKLLNNHLQEHKDTDLAKNSAVVFLGDNIYEHGLPSKLSSDRDFAEKQMTLQLDVVKKFPGQLVYVPGNHDWNNSQKGGYEAVKREQNFVQSYMQKEDVFFPKDGCPGPVEIPLGDDFVIIAVDSEWFLHTNYRPSYPDCSVESEQDFFFEFKRAVKRNEGKHIMIAMHHPMFSNGNHGGYFSLKDNLFPLTLINSNNKLYLPLPIIGSVYSLLRKYGISSQDIGNSKYQELIKGLMAGVEGINNVTFASGHDHNLQLTQKEGHYFVVSGSGSKVNYARQGKRASYVQSAQGLAKINYYNNGEAWIEYYVVSDENPMGELTFRTALYAISPKESVLVEDEDLKIDYSDSTKTIIAGAEYKASGFRNFLFGKHYRKEWITPVKADFLRINNFAGGLKPVKQGGGKQTISLRMVGRDGVEYNLRSLNKNPEGAIPRPFQNTFAQDFVKDQISTAHPYGAFAIAPMAKAAGLYHTNPQLVYVPFSPVLAEHLDVFGGMTALLEIRPDEDLSDYSRFGNSKNIVSTNTFLEHLREDNDNSLDKEMFLKTRLFDLLINDWDRHADQWRWAEYDKKGKGSYFRPVPRDRDQVFTKYDGVIPWLSSRKWAVRNVVNFGDDFKDVVGAMLTGSHLDRRLLSEMDLDDWEKGAEELQNSLTDDVIEYSINQMPEEIVGISGDEIIRKLKSRRDGLKDAARLYFTKISKEVDLVGTDKHELYTVDRKADGYVLITVHKTKKEGDTEQVIYERTFNPDITKEIRIYTFEGKDKVVIKGLPSKDIRIRIITSQETNLISNQSNTGKIIVYKDKYSELETEGDDIRIKASDKPLHTKYELKSHKYNYVGPRISIEFNRDAGIFVGGGVNWRTYGFKKTPFRSSQTIIANYATSVGAYNVSYSGEFPDLFGDTKDLIINSNYRAPQYVFNYFGEGNGSVNNQPIDFYRLDMAGFSQQIFFRKNFSDYLKLELGPTYNYYNVESETDNITSDETLIDRSDLSSTGFLGGDLNMTLKKTDYDLYPRNGLSFNNYLQYRKELNGDSEFLKIRSDFSVYLTPNLPIYLTLAMRFGAEKNIGNYPFFNSAFLGQNGGLRGYRIQRFAGNANVFQNTELRLGVSKISNYLFNGYWGVFGFLDHGRVWTDNSEFDINKWQRGYGPGIWVNFFGIFMTSTGVGFSDEGKYFYLRAGMSF